MHITLVEPSVSTAIGRRTIAPRAANRRMPTASVIVTTAVRPSGIAATASETRSSRLGPSALPRMRNTIVSAAQMPAPAHSRDRAKPSSCRCSGVSGRSCPASSAISSTSVRGPVAVTTIRARPRDTKVPA